MSKGALFNVTSLKHISTQYVSNYIKRKYTKHYLKDKDHQTRLLKTNVLGEEVGLWEAHRFECPLWAQRKKSQLYAV